MAGGVGQDGLFLKDALEAEQVNASLVALSDTPTGHAIIQVDQQGDNAIVLFGGANQCVTGALIHQALAPFAPGDLILLQNEINLVPEIIRQAKERGLSVALNPSPASPEMSAWPLEQVDWLILNEVEGRDLTAQTDPQGILDALLVRYPNCRVVLTLGEDGAFYADRTCRCFQPAFHVKATDTTAAGDTFTGYFLTAALSGHSPQASLRTAACAAAMAVCRPGASASIPMAAEVLAHLSAQA